MSIPANKADNVTPAYEIKLKRTSKTSTDTSIKDGILEDGEPLYNKADKTFSIGDGATSVSELAVVHFIPKTLSSQVIYHTPTDNNIITLKNESGDSVYPQTKFWATGTQACFDFSTATGWEYQDTDGSWKSLRRVPKTSDVEKNTIRQKINVTGVLPSNRVYISLCLTDAELLSVASTKSAEKVFGTITGVESVKDNIYVYCKKVRENAKCYLNVFGG